MYLLYIKRCASIKPTEQLINILEMFKTPLVCKTLHGSLFFTFDEVKAENHLVL